MRHSRTQVTIIATIVSLVATALFATPHAVADGDPPVAQIVGGGPVADGTYPFVAAILAEYDGAESDYDRQICGGSLVHPNWVLTAAHCVDEGATPEHVSVTVGRTVLSSHQGERFAVSDIVIHPDYALPYGLQYDVALLRLSGTSRVAPIRVAALTDSVYEADGTMLTLAGWGSLVSYPDWNRPDRLHAVDLPAIGDEDCYGNVFLCAGAAGPNACFGDSGSPLFATEPSGSVVQMGTASWIPTPYCGVTGEPSVYVDLNNAQIRTFIRHILTVGPRTPRGATEDCGAPGDGTSSLAKFPDQSAQQTIEELTGYPSPGAVITAFCVPDESP